MITREEIEKILSKYPFINPPSHIYVLDAPILVPQLKAIAKGMYPGKKDIIFLTPQADEETIIHEIIHTYGFGELITYPLAKILVRFRNTFPPILKRNIQYEELEINPSELEKYGLRIYPKGSSGKIKLYIRK